MSRLNFRLQVQAMGSRARAGLITTLHGDVETPVFMPVGTQATVKAQTRESLRATGSSILLANTFHLFLRPGPEVFKKFGGIHQFMNWDGPVLTDSGGYQIFSLAKARTMNEQGAEFESYVDGRRFLLSPEESISMQRAIGSDIMMVLDQCIPSTAERSEAVAAMDLTHRWAKRSLAARGDSPQALFGIVQGACFHDLRRQSADFLTAMPFDGFAIGGLAVGEGIELRNEFTEATAALLPSDRPRYLMGVGTPLDILEGVHRGVDMFDCIIPTFFAQRGGAFTSQGKLQFRRTVYRLSDDKLDPECSCPVCQTYSRAYLHHLIKCEEVLGWHLLGQHNLTFYHRMMREIRQSICAGNFESYYAEKKRLLLQSDEENPPRPSQRRRPRSHRWRRLGDYEIHESPAGFSSIRQTSSGEIMHSVSDPVDEANRLYIEQSRLAERIGETDATPAAPLVIWDVGLGAATNAMAALRCFERVFSEKNGKVRSCAMVSFERDLNPLLLASKHAELFVHLRHAAPYSVLKNKQWLHASGLFSWKLLEGDFLERLSEAPVPDLIFYDPFSFKTDSELWTSQTFARVLQHCRSGNVELYTYSASTAVRAALLHAGFFVGRGAMTGPKAETTIASAGSLSPRMAIGLLGSDWLARWHRSGAKFPAGMSEAGRSDFESRILAHPQFVART